ncbi:hypothetical protein QES_4068 [Clostridioides difficile CD149]|uniref:hypothetical protein n=7 Tax=Clostridioides difficile TaxID=1496 RepID=UPI00038CB3C1|nr:hypothetical protein [Clostridioides difficile]AUO78536.1 hypothetical protein LIBA2945_00146 [Clostridioides phage LIBA2945]OFU33082.1 hypothetical protein HMPREF3076_02415 [Clostridium sp. HMSC19B12]EGT3652886.1 hypothetical protein [Clostridioides difficile]EGT3825861.1 hypothetical protein [Clostridioides difficile]EGT3961233.1 hypothetical protein [Clostridioides difficile]
MKEELNIVPFLAESLSINKKCYKLIDKYYNENKLKYSSLAKDNIFYNSRIASEGSIIQEYYFKKSLGILLERDEKKITKIFKVGYTIAYNYIISIQTFKASTFLRKLMLKNKIESFSEDELNGNMLVAISLCGALGKEVDESDEIYIKVIRNLILRNENYKHEKVLSIDRLSKDEQKLISKIELRLKSTYLKEYIPSSYTIGIDGSIGTFNLDALTDLDRNLLGFDYIYDLEELSLISIVGRDIFKSKQIQELILCYCNLQKNIEDENSINYEDLFKFIIPAIDIRYLAREYKKAKQFFFNNFDEELKESIEEKDLKLDSIKKENSLLEAENEKLKSELELLQKDKLRLENEIKAQLTSKEELVQLRNFMFNQQQEQEEKVLIDESINLKNIKAIIFGGHPNWILKMKEKLTNFEFISADTINFNVNILNSYEYVFINTNFIGHAMYYKIIENLNEDNKLRYINNINVDRAIEAIKNAIKI